MTYRPQPATTSHWMSLPRKQESKWGPEPPSGLSISPPALPPTSPFQYKPWTEWRGLSPRSLSHLTHIHTHTHETYPFSAFVYRQLQQWEQGISHYPSSYSLSSPVTPGIHLHQQTPASPPIPSYLSFAISAGAPTDPKPTWGWAWCPGCVPEHPWGDSEVMACGGYPALRSPASGDLLPVHQSPNALRQSLSNPLIQR